MGRLVGVAGIDAPGGVVKGDGRVRLQQLHVGFPQALGGAHVLPVALEGIGEHAAAGVQHGGQHVLAEIVGRFFVFVVGDEEFADALPVENVDAHGGQVVFGLGRLFVEFHHPEVLVGVEDAEAGSLFHGHPHHGDGAVRLVLFMVSDEAAVVHLVDVVAGQDQQQFGIVAVHEIHVLENGVGRAAVPFAGGGFHVRRQDEGPAGAGVQVPGSAGADIGVELQRLVLGKHAYGVDTGISAVGQGEIDDLVLAAEGHRGLGPVLGEDAQAAALAAGQQHGYAVFLSDCHYLHLPFFLRSTGVFPDAGSFFRRAFGGCSISTNS